MPQIKFQQFKVHIIHCNTADVKYALKAEDSLSLSILDLPSVI